MSNDFPTEKNNELKGALTLAAHLFLKAVVGVFVSAAISAQSPPNAHIHRQCGKGKVESKEEEGEEEVPPCDKEGLQSPP